jgi:hypothetical protein
MTKKSQKPSLPPRLAKRLKQGSAAQKRCHASKTIPLTDAAAPDGLLSALEKRSREFVKASAQPTAKLQKLAAGGIAKQRLDQKTRKNKPVKRGKSR